MKLNRTHPAARLMLGLAAGLLVSGAVAGLAMVGLALSEWTKTSPAFKLNTIDVAGNRLVGKEDIIAVSGLERGRNIWSADLSETERRLMLDRRFVQVAVTRRLPGTVVVRVEELQPIAFVQLDRLYGVSERGELIPLTPGNGLPDLPVITVDASSYRQAPGTAEPEDRSFESLRDAMSANPEMARALYLMRVLRTMSPAMYDELSEIHVSSPDDPVAYMVEGGLAIRFGTGHYPRKIEMLKRTVEQLEADAIRTRLIDLRFKDQVIVRPIVSNRSGSGRS
ncbi:MAG: FtsQ-type POTRA domain-containing protein [Gemmatimonadetes bacterium]|nr:FtsQ-type POTRA domain-containing protein [Gemmatimonadota bacterium]MYB61527.1 FtsQ-type POTRA domain-containing protein [Gemmatimonadota bacterium]